MAQRICGTGFDLFRQAGEHIQGGACDAALVVGTESMTRNPIAAFDHRTGFKAYNLDTVLGGELDAVVESAMTADEQARLAALGEGTA